MTDTDTTTGYYGQPNPNREADAFDAALAQLVFTLGGEFRSSNSTTVQLTFPTCVAADAAKLVIDGFAGLNAGWTGEVFGLGHLMVTNPHRTSRWIS